MKRMKRTEFPNIYECSHVWEIIERYNLYCSDISNNPSGRIFSGIILTKARCRICYEERITAG